MKAIVPSFELPEKWQTLDRLSAYGTSAFEIIPEVWPDGVTVTVEPDEDDHPSVQPVRLEVQERESAAHWMGRELHFKTPGSDCWVSRRAAHQAIEAAVEKEFKKARARWLKTQKASGALAEARKRELEEAQAEEDSWRDEVEEAFNESAAHCARVAHGSEEDEEWRQFWHAVDRLGVVVAKARAAIKARKSAEGRVQ